MKAEMIISGFFRGDTGESGRNANDNMYSRDTNVGLSGSFGRVQLGRSVAPSFLSMVQFNPFGGSFNFSPLILHGYVSTGPAGNRNWTAANAADNGWSNQLIYSTPSFGGFKANFHYQFGEAANDSDSRNMGANIFYTQNAFDFSAFVHDIEASNPNSGRALIDTTNSPVNYAAINRQKAYFMGASYKLPIAKLFATFQINKNTTGDSRDLMDKVYSTGLNVPMASGALLIGYAHTRRSGSLLTSDRDRKTFTIGYDHFLSKRVDLYTMVKLDRISTTSTATSFGTGIRYNF
jgi:predicted porin